MKESVRWGQSRVQVRKFFRGMCIVHTWQDCLASFYGGWLTWRCLGGWPCRAAWGGRSPWGRTWAPHPPSGPASPAGEGQLGKGREISMFFLLMVESIKAYLFNGNDGVAKGISGFVHRSISSWGEKGVIKHIRGTLCLFLCICPVQGITHAWQLIGNQTAKSWDIYGRRHEARHLPVCHLSITLVWNLEYTISTKKYKTIKPIKFMHKTWVEKIKETNFSSCMWSISSKSDCWFTSLSVHCSEKVGLPRHTSITCQSIVRTWPAIEWARVNQYQHLLPQIHPQCFPLRFLFLLF